MGLGALEDSGPGVELGWEAGAQCPRNRRHGGSWELGCSFPTVRGLCPSLAVPGGPHSWTRAGSVGQNLDLLLVSPSLWLRARRGDGKGHPPPRVPPPGGHCARVSLWALCQRHELSLYLNLDGFLALPTSWNPHWLPSRSPGSQKSQ